MKIKPLVREALNINTSLPGVIFIGAIARYFHTQDLRDSQDIDFAIIKPLSDEFLIDRGYRKFKEGKKEVWRSLDHVFTYLQFCRRFDD
jgi:hypothetical protein